MEQANITTQQARDLLNEARSIVDRLVSRGRPPMTTRPFDPGRDEGFKLRQAIEVGIACLDASEATIETAKKKSAKKTTKKKSAKKTAKKKKR